MAAGERALGPETYQRDVGHFWGLLETRPYMREGTPSTALLWDVLVQAMKKPAAGEPHRPTEIQMMADEALGIIETAPAEQITYGTCRSEIERRLIAGELSWEQNDLRLKRSVI